jgi:hypothetical protein
VASAVSPEEGCLEKRRPDFTLSVLEGYNSPWNTILDSPLIAIPSLYHGGGLDLTMWGGEIYRPTPVPACRANAQGWQLIAAAQAENSNSICGHGREQPKGEGHY